MPQAPRFFEGRSLVIASHNEGKVREFRDLLEPYLVEVKSARELALPEPIEDGATFADNAKIKALSAAHTSGLPALADDSGLCVTSLGGAPGIYSARWAGPEKDFTSAMEKIHRDLEAKGVHTPRAHFWCALCLGWPDGHADVFEGQVHGNLVWPLRGARGFGYDPMFLPDGENETFGEMDPLRKHALSHRARAFESLIHACFQER